MDNRPTRVAFVSTNSICQGEQVEPTWRNLFEEGVRIDFAWPTFVWDSQAADQAHVHCVIIGFSFAKNEKAILYGAEPRTVDNINGYLSPAPNVFVRARGKAVDSHHLKMIQGSKPVDGGHLIIKDGEHDGFIERNPGIREYVREYVGAEEFMNGKKRYCLWLKDAPVSLYMNSDEIIARLEGVRETRLQSPTKEFREYADRPTLFVQDRQPNSDYLLFPSHTSSRREYVPVGFMSSETIVSNAVYIIPGAGLYDFGLVSSQFHNAWIRSVAGRLKSDYRYTPGVYASFSYPDPTEEQKERVVSAARRVLEVRESFGDIPLSTMYDPDKRILFGDLYSAHHALDTAVEAAYGVDFGGDEEKIVAHLFKLYAERVGE